MNATFEIIQTTLRQKFATAGTFSAVFNKKILYLAILYDVIVNRCEFHYNAFC